VDVTDGSGSGPVTVPAASPRGAPVPPWLGNLAALSWRLLAIALLVVVSWSILSALAVVTAAIAVSVVVSAVLVPATRRLRARGRSRSAAAAIVWTLGLAVVTALVVVLVIAFLPQLASALEAAQAAIAALQSDSAALQVPPAAADLVRVIADAGVSVVEGIISTAASSIAAIITSLVLAVFLVFFLLRDGDRAWAWCLQALAPDKQAELSSAGEQALGRVAGYLVGTTLLSALAAGTSLVFMLLLGVPMAVPLALLVFFAGYIPYFGGIVTTLIVLLVTYGTLGLWATVVMLALITARNVVIGYAVRPSVYGRSVQLHPAVVLIALPAGYQLAGVIGLFAAVPLLAVILTVASAVVDVLQPEDPPELPGLVPAWLDRVAQWSWRLLATLGLVVIAVAVVVDVPLVVVPALLGVILAATFAPLVRWLEGRGRAHSRAIGIALGTTGLVVAVLLLLAVGVLAEQAAAIAAGMVDGASTIDDAAGGSTKGLVDVVEQLGASGLQTLAALVSGLSSAVVAGVLAALLCFYFLRDGDRLWTLATARVLPEYRDEVRATGGRAFEVMGGYMYGTAAISFVGAASQLVIMVVLGIPLAMPVFVLSFFLCFIPYIGGFISTGIALLLTIATGTPTDIAIMVAWTLVFNIVTGNIVSPIVYGRTVHLHPAIVLVAIPIGSAVAGMLGMLLVVPILGVVAVSWRTVLSVMAASSASAGTIAPRAEPPPSTEALELTGTEADVLAPEAT
jgi:predicted PurR-regulated permease PerM